MSDQRTYVIVGNGIAGTTAAQQIRKAEPASRIVLMTDEPHPLYNRVALPPLLKGKVTEQKVFMRTVEFHEKNNIELRLETRATAVNTRDKTVQTNRGQEFRYDRLLIATGGRPNKLGVPGAAGTANIFNFQTMDDTRALIAAALESKTAVVTGGSYIAYELAEGLRTRGLHVSWLIRGPRFLRRILDEEGGELVTRIAKSHGVEMIYGEEIASVKARDGKVAGVVTTSGREIEADMVGAGLGLTLNTNFLQGSGIETHKGIVTNEFLETSLPDVYAAGDVAEFFDLNIGRHNLMGTWDNAGSHGRVVAQNMMGGRERYEEVPTYTTTMFHTRMTVAGITPESTPDLESVSRVDYDGEQYRKLFFREGRLVGVAIIGEVRARAKYMDLIRSKTPVPESERGALLDL